MLKKFTAFLLLIALFVNVMGYYVIFQYNQILLRHEMANQIRSGTYQGKLETITIQKNSPDINLQFSDTNEIYYHGILYDVVAVVSTKDTITYSCIPDKNEQSLINNFSLIFHNHSGCQDSNKANPLLAMILNLVNQGLVQKLISPKQDSGKSFLFNLLIYHTIRVFLPVINPPPEAN